MNYGSLHPKEKKWCKEKFRIPKILISRKKMSKKYYSEFLKHFLKLFRNQNSNSYLSVISVNSEILKFLNFLCQIATSVPILSFRINKNICYMENIGRRWDL